MDHARVSGALILFYLFSAVALRVCSASPVEDISASRVGAINSSSRQAEDIPEPWEVINVMFYIEKWGCDVQDLEKQWTSSKSARVLQHMDRNHVFDDDDDHSWAEKSRSVWNSVKKTKADELCYISLAKERRKCCEEATKRERKKGTVDDDAFEACMEEGEEYFEWLDEGSIHLDGDKENYMERELEMLSKVVEMQMASDVEHEVAEDGDVELGHEEEVKKVKKERQRARQKLKDMKRKKREKMQRAKERRRKRRAEGRKAREARRKQRDDSKIMREEAQARRREWMQKVREERKKQRQEEKERREASRAAISKAKGEARKLRQKEQAERRLKKFVQRMKSAEVAILAHETHAIPGRVLKDYQQFRKQLSHCYKDNVMGTFYKKSEKRWMACTMLRSSKARVGYCADLREVDGDDKRLKRAPIHCFESGRLSLQLQQLQSSGEQQTASALTEAASRSSAEDAKPVATAATQRAAVTFVDLFSTDGDACLQSDISYTCYALCCDTMYYGSHFCRDSGTTCLG